MKGRETIFIPRRSKGESERYIACNGKRVLVKCGEEVEVSSDIAEVWRNAQMQRAQAEERIRDLSVEGI